jgi:hypothetical protein
MTTTDVTGEIVAEKFHLSGSGFSFKHFHISCIDPTPDAYECSLGLIGLLSMHIQIACAQFRSGHQARAR